MQKDIIRLNIKSKEEGNYYIDIRNALNNNRVRTNIKLEKSQVVLIYKMFDLLENNIEIWQGNDVLFSTKQAENILYANFSQNDSTKEVIETVLKILNKLIDNEEDNTFKFEEGYLTGKNDKINVLLLGQFGVGKSSIIKALTGFKSDINIPVVDTSRTTTYESKYILKQYSGGIKYGYVIHFKSKKDIIRNVEDCTNRSVETICKLMIDNKLKKDIEDQAIQAFITDPNKLFKIHYILGNYYAKQNKKREKVDSIYIDRYIDIYNKIASLVNKIFIKEFDLYNEQLFGDEFSDSLDIQKHQEKITEILQLKNYEVESLQSQMLEYLKERNFREEFECIVDDVVEELLKKKEEICVRLENNNLGTCFYDTTGIYKELVGFGCENYNVETINDCLKYFVSNESKLFGEILTPLVSKMILEAPLAEGLEAIGQNNKMFDITFTDTIGYEHRKQEDTKSLEGASQLAYDKYDIMLVVDNAKASMSATTEVILDNIYRNAMRDKIKIVYTHYNSFEKNDIDDDDEYAKQQELLDLQTATLNKIIGSNNQSDIYSQSASKFIDELNARTLFLKDLVGKNESLKEEYRGFGFRPLLIKQIINQYEGLYDFKRLDIKDRKKTVLEYNYKKIILAFEQAKEEFIDVQHSIYKVNCPHYKTTEALTKRLMEGETYFAGSGITLKPVDDFVYILMDKLKQFISTPLTVNFTEKSTMKDQLLQVLELVKEQVSTRVSKLIKDRFVYNHGQTWRDTYFDWGPGVDRRRRGVICDTFDAELPDFDFSKLTLSDIWVDKIEEIINGVLDELKEYALQRDSLQ